MPNIPVRSAAAALIALTSACAVGSTATIASDAAPASPGIRGRMLVAGRLGADTPEMRAFPGHLGAELRACGIEPDIVIGWVNPVLALEGDAMSRSVAERQAIGPGAILEMNVTDLDDRPGALRWSYALRLRAADGATAWRARIDFRPHFGWGRNDPSADLARMIVGRMAADGVLRSCPASRA